MNVNNDSDVENSLDIQWSLCMGMKNGRVANTFIEPPYGLVLSIALSTIEISETLAWIGDGVGREGG